jgi:biopolymer transport protein TolR
VDVMLVLVVIFILTAPLLASAIRLDLPRAEGTAPAAAPRALTLVLDRQGQLFVDDQPVPSAAALARRLGEVAQAAPDTEVQLRADAAVPYGRVVEIMGAAHAGGPAAHRLRGRPGGCGPRPGACPETSFSSA